MCCIFLGGVPPWICTDRVSHEPLSFDLPPWIYTDFVSHRFFSSDCYLCSSAPSASTTSSSTMTRSRSPGLRYASPTRHRYISMLSFPLAISALWFFVLLGLLSMLLHSECINHTFVYDAPGLQACATPRRQGTRFRARGTRSEAGAGVFFCLGR